MSHNLYIAAVEPRSGKSVIALGLMQLLSRELDELGFFRPIVRAPDQADNDIELIRSRFCPDREYDELVGVPHDDARQLAGGGDYDALLKRVFERYKKLEQECEFVLCEGTDYTGIVSAFEFEFNAEVAKHLGCSVLLVTNGRGKTLEDIISVARTARDAFREEGCTIAATIINRVEPTQVQQLQDRLSQVWKHSDPVFVLREEPILSSPTIAEIGRAINARRLHGEPEGLNREVQNFRIAAMHLSNYLEYVAEGSLIITPGDRADVILASLTTLYSDNFPDIAGIILTGGLTPGEAVNRLVEGFKLPSVPVYLVDDDTYTAAMKVNAVRSGISPQNERKIAVALGVFESSVDAALLRKQIEVTRSTRVTPLMFEYELVERAKAHPQHIVLPEGSEGRILQAAEILQRREVVKLTLLGNEKEIRERAREIGIDAGQFEIVDPLESPWHDEFSKTYFELRKHKGITEDYAHDVMHDVSYFGTMMVYMDRADGMVSGSVNTTAHTIRPAFEIIRARPNVSIVSSVFFMCLEDRVLVYGDCAVNPNPNPQQLADIAISSAATAAIFGIEPRVAMLSYSTGASGGGEEVDEVREATRIARELRPDLQIEGPIQYDAAVDAGVAKTKMPDSPVAGRATVYVFPDLNAGNNTYKAVQRSANAVAVGPVLQGLNKPVNDLSRGCTVKDIVNTVAITAIQAQRVDGLE